MSAINTFVKTITIFTILAGLIGNAMPGKKYNKYVNLFVGIIMMVIIVKFFMGANSKNVIDDALKKSLKNTIYVGDENIENIREVCEQKVHSDAESFLQSYDYVIKETKVSIDTDSESETYGKITDVSVKYTDKNSEEIKVEKINIETPTQSEEKGTLLKQYIQEKYGLKESEVRVSYEE